MVSLLVLLSALAWLWLSFLHGRFWSSGPVLDRAQPSLPLKVTVVIPARDEADHIAATLQSLLDQQFSGDLQIVLVDDNSSDATGQLARSMAGTDPRLHVIDGTALPDGWTGKLWAVSQGLASSQARAADYVLLTDADIIHAPAHLAALAAHARRHNLGLVSEMVRLRTETFAERATVPAFVFFFQMLYPFAWVADPRRSTAAAAGGTMLLSRQALDRVDGVSPIRAALIDDVALARQVKRAGFGIWLGHAEQASSERRYPGFGDVWSLIARTAYVQLGYSPWILAGTCAGLLLMYVEPVVAGIFAHGALRWCGIACWAAMAAAFQPTLRHYGRSWAWGLALPAIAVFYLLATIGSAIDFHRGRGGRWKQRTYPAAGEP